MLAFLIFQNLRRTGTTGYHRQELKVRKSPRSDRRPFFILLTLLVLGGCASKTISVKVDYDVQNASPATIPKAGTIILYVDNFVDVRGKERTVVGEAKTGAFNLATPILVRHGRFRSGRGS